MENNCNYIQALILFDKGQYKELLHFTGLKDITQFKREMCSFLYNEIKWKTRDIANVLGYAMGTVRNYAKKFICSITNFLKLAYAGVKARFTIKQSPTFTYLIYMYDRPNHIKYLKVGKTFEDRMLERMNELRKKYNCTIKIEQLYLFKNENQALTMENYLRQYYIDVNGGADYEPNDRFTMSRVTDADKTRFREKEKNILENF